LIIKDYNDGFNLNFDSKHFTLFFL